MRRHRLPGPALAATVALAAALAGCAPAAEQSLTDPRDILTRTLSATAGLRTASVRIELELRDPNNPNAGVGGVDGGSLEAQVDLAGSAFSARAVDARGVELARLISVDESIFVTTGGDGRWQQQRITPEMLANPSSLLFLGLGGGGGPGPDFVGIFGAAIGDRALGIELAGVEDCAAGRCYRVTVEVPRESVWPLIVGLMGLDRIPGVQPPEPALDDLPTISVTVLVDTATLHLVELTGGGSIAATSAQVRLLLADHDSPVSIRPPPPELVDPPAGGGAGGPQPVPAQPVPAAPTPAPVPVPTQP
jgi:hypothetical protein